MKLKVSLDNGGGEIAAETVENPKATASDEMSDEIQGVIEGWVLSAGDTISIREAP